MTSVTTGKPVTLRASALNHRDVWIQQGMYAGIQYPIVPGSDGAGVVTAVGEGVDAAWLNREVVINPSFDWGSSPRAFGDRFAILGLPLMGLLDQLRRHGELAA